MHTLRPILFSHTFLSGARRAAQPRTTYAFPAARSLTDMHAEATPTHALRAITLI